MGALDPLVRSAQRRAYSNARRARKRSAEITGPVSVAVYREILESGPCVYCGAPGEHVDHVHPLSRGGWEHVSNLVPACSSCNLSKHASLLTEWRSDRVRHGINHSPIVAAEWLRLTEGSAGAGVLMFV